MSGEEEGETVSITFEVTEDGTIIVASLGEASVTVEASPDGWGENVGILVTALPQILEATWAQIDGEDEDNQEEE